MMRHTTHWAHGASAARPAAEDRIDATFGVTYLFVGFVLQAIGYVLDLAGVTTVSADSTPRTITALVLLAAAILVAFGAWHVSHERLVRRLLLEMAYWQPTQAGE